MTEPLITEPGDDVECIVPVSSGFHVRLKGWFLAEHTGRGATVEEAYRDAQERRSRTIKDTPQWRPT